MTDEILCIVNPRAGDGAWSRQRARVLAAFADAGLRARFLETRGPGDGAGLAREALAAGARRVVAIGGDGTIHEVANGFFDPASFEAIAPEAELGVVPLGSGSDFVKTAGIPAGIEAAVALLASGTGRAIDVLRFSCAGSDGEPRSGVAVNTISAGATGVALAARNALPAALPGFLRKELGYVLGGLMHLGRFRALPLEGERDGEPWREPAVLAVILANGQAFGKGMRIAPEAELDDGRIDAVWAGTLGPLELLELIMRLFGGSHLALRGVRFARARRVRLAPPEPWLLEIDGEQPGTTPLEVSLLPLALRVVRPAGSRDRAPTETLKEPRR